jgi:hypothetical protein
MIKLEKEKLIKVVRQTSRSLFSVFPSILATVLLISLIFAIIPSSFYYDVLTHNTGIDIFISNLVGGLSAGNPIISYIIGGELLSQGIPLVVVTVFIISWVTVGVIQLPAESIILGKKFAIWRNITAFFLAILGAFLTAFIINLL